MDTRLDPDPDSGPRPSSLTRFIGRERELAALDQLLLRARVVTLVGAPGVGKTRLAREWADRARANDPLRIWFVDLAPLESPALLPQVIAGTLGLLEQRSRSPADALVDHLRMSRVLLILDNCEHLVSACASLVDHLVRAAPGVRILATSREPLSIEGEAVWRVPSLSCPEAGRPMTPDALLPFESARLFADRAGAVRPEFAITEANAAPIAQICARLDGIPLALELAAARLSVLSASQIAARLDDSLRLLTGGHRTSPPRRQTLRAAIDWSYALLTEPEARLLARLSMFSGGWTLEAAEAVCAIAGTDAPDILDLLSTLLGKSLLELVQRGEVVRYRLLEPIRQYGRARLREYGEEALLATRHAAWLSALVEQAEPQLYGPEQAAGLATLDAEQGNVRTALAWCVSDATEASSDLALRLVHRLCRYWSVRDRMAEGYGWQEAVLAGAPDRPSGPLARVLLHAANFGFEQGEWARAEGLADRALAMGRELGDLGSIGHALKVLSTLGAARRGEIRPSMIAEAIGYLQQVGDEWGVWNCLCDLGELQRHGGRLDEAIQTHEQALALARGRREDWAIGCSLRNVARVSREAGDGERTHRLLEEALVIWKRLGTVRGVNSILVERARLALDAEQRLRAATLLDEALAVSRDSGDRARVADCLVETARLLALTGRTGRAATLCGAAEGLREDVRTPRTPLERHTWKALVDAVHGAMSDVSFATAWAEGRGLPLETAVEAALDAVRQIQSSRAPDAEDVSRTESVGLASTSNHLRPGCLTRRERETAVLVARGLTNRQIAADLVITERTAAAHVGHILEKLDLASRTQVAAWAIGQGLLTTPAT